MNELSRHITGLLLEHNCVIVPRLGGFVVGYVPATYIPEEGVMLPPRRSVGFTVRLTINDGLLVQSYMRAYDVGYAEAVKMIGKAVDELKVELRETGEVEIGSIGILSLRLDGHYDFTPSEAGVPSPELYGLSSVHALFDASSLPGVSVDEEPPSVAKAESSSASSLVVSRIRRGGREFVNYVAAAVIALVFYVAWAPAVESPEIHVMSKEAAMPWGGGKIGLSRTRPVVRQERQEKMVAPVNHVANSHDSQEKAVEESSVEQAERYTLVLVSMIPESGAQTYVEELRKAGLADATIFVNKKMVRVIYGSYVDKGKAYNALSDLRKSHADFFAEAWVMNLPPVTR